MILHFTVFSSLLMPAPVAGHVKDAELSPTPATVDDTSLRWYDLRALMAASAKTEAGVDLRLHLASSHIDTLEPNRWDMDLGVEPALDLDDCRHLIVRAAGSVAGGDDAVIELRSGMLSVRGTEAVHLAVKEAVESLSQVTTDSVPVVVYRVPDSALPEGTSPILNKADAAKLVASLKGIAVARHSVRIGRSSGIGDEETTSFLADHDVEVAQGAIAADPVVSVLRTGLDAGVRVDRAADGRRFVVRTWGRDGSLRGDFATHALGAFGDAPVELPTVGTSLWTASGVLEAGGALVIDHDGGGKEALIVRIAEDAQPEGPRAALAFGELAMTPMRVAAPFLQVASPSGGWGRDDDEFVQRTARWADDQSIAELAEEQVMDLLGSDALFPMGTTMLTGTPGILTDAVRGTVASLAAAVPAESIGVELRYAILDADAARAAQAGEGLSAFAGSATGRLLGSAIENDSLLLVGGVETAYLQDHDVQIAAGAVIPDPVVKEYFEGISIWCAPLRSHDGRLSAWFDVQGHAELPAVRKLTSSSFVPEADSGNKDNPKLNGTFEKNLPMDLPVTARAAARTLVHADEGAWTLVAAQPIGDSTNTLVVAVRMKAY